MSFLFLFLCLGHAYPASFHADPAYAAPEVTGSRDEDLLPESSSQHLHPGHV